MRNQRTANIAKSGVISALYVVVTLAIAPFGFGAVQVRLSEMFNHLAIFKKQYIVAIALGCAIANMFSPLGIVDIVFGSLGSLMTATFVYFITKKFKNLKTKLAVSCVIQVLCIWSVGVELSIFYKLPFLPTYGTLMIGEAISAVLGAFLIYGLSKRIDFTK